MERMRSEHRAYALRMRAAAPAFPRAATVVNGNTEDGGSPGMTIREAFAMATMQGLLAQGAKISVGEMAMQAVECADALLAALAEEPKP